MTEIMLMVLASLQPVSPSDRAGCQIDAASAYMQCLGGALDVAIECEQESLEADCRGPLRASVRLCGDDYRDALEECDNNQGGGERR